MNADNYIISIGRQLGSGGAEMGKELADHFGFQYANKEILMGASEELNISEENLEWIEEKNFSIWGALVQSSILELPYIPEGQYMPTGRQLFETQTQLLKKVSEGTSCVIVGRCGSHLFRNHPRHISIFLRANTEYREERLTRTMDITTEQARKLMEKVDKERARYYSTYTGQKWLDLRQYDICLNSGPLTMEQMKVAAIDYICAKFPELANK